MSVIIAEQQLPHELTAEQSVEAAYAQSLRDRLLEDKVIDSKTLLTLARKPPT